jgi:hypothetical protein
LIIVPSIGFWKNPLFIKLTVQNSKRFIKSRTIKLFMLSEDELKRRLAEISRLKGFLYTELQTSKYHEIFYTLKKIKDHLKKVMTRSNKDLINDYIKKINNITGSYQANNLNVLIVKDFLNELSTEKIEMEAKRHILQMEVPVANAVLIVCSKGRNQFAEQFKDYNGQDKTHIVDRTKYLIRLAFEKIHLFSKNHTTLKQTDIVMAPSVEIMKHNEGLSSLRINKGDRIYWYFKKMPLSELKSKYLNKIIDHQQINNVQNEMIYVLFLCEIVSAAKHETYKANYRQYGPWTEFNPVDIILGEQYGIAA